ncbi:proline dehydrogenase family protein [Labilibaculum euxinus]|uniref:proline dehydrogenase n=1 Tax=Labilibaculum euxinus TaxID=2686357 RepID=A0A7M4D331_9BACT|nr:proline dehydrogenase family protein [Labilibaculum euxinus]MUP37060.1 proline dehydrogenase [Labilibaculum euxinus]MVB06265.1 proline dehydrogenase [Labilibaculum euxinus]
MDELLLMGSSALKKIALDKNAKEYLLNNKPLYQILRKAANRYIGGETLEETIPKVLKENNNGFKCSIEFMGENIKTEDEVNQATQEFIRIVQGIRKQNLNSTISLDLSHIGLAISSDLCLNKLYQICEATQNDIEIIISAEGVERTDMVIETYKKASKKHPNLAITLQAYLYRSKDDFQDLIREDGRIRIVKGAFYTPEGHSIPRGKKLDDRYLDYVDQLLSKNHKCSIATHHHEIQQEAKLLIDKYNPDNELYEFESLYGIQTEQLVKLKKEGYMTKLYFVYGHEWYLYLCNRIAEYPLNLFRALNDIVE